MSLESTSILDIHHHLTLQPTSTQSDIRQDYEARVRIMDQNGIEQAVVTPRGGFYRPRGLDDTRRINDLVAEYVVRYHDRFPIGLGTVLPLQGQDGLLEIDRALSSLGLRGFEWHHMNLGAPIDHEMMYQFLAKLQDLDVPAFIHAFPESLWEAPWRLEKVAADFPRLRIVALSALCVWSYIEPVIRIAEGHPNIMLDTLVFPVNQILERCVERLGADRLFFGSDLVPCPASMSYHHAAALEELRLSPTLTVQQKRLIVGENARRMFGLI